MSHCRELLVETLEQENKLDHTYVLDKKSSEATSVKIVNKHFTQHLMPYLSVVLETKLKPPSQQGDLIERPRLKKLLSGTTETPLLFISAPAGYGKTSLLAQLYHQEKESDEKLCAWFTVDKTDNDIVRFAHGVVESVRKTIPTFGDDILGLIERGANPSSETLMSLFINATNQLPCSVRIHIDDFHLIKNDELLETVGELFLRSSANLYWIVAMRHVPLGLPIGRLRALGRLGEIEVDDLRFTLDESREFFSSNEVSLSMPDLALLADRTEGWVAGLQLASLSLKKVNNPQTWIDELSGEYRDIANFLTDEVIRTLDDSVREFLFQTSILTRFNQDLCTAVTQMKNCQALLEQVIASHLFIFSLDETNDWYRYHHLFAEFLERRLREADQDKYKELHLRASVWYEKNNFYLDAIQHACMADDMLRAATLLDHVSETLFSTGHAKTLEVQAARIPTDILHRQPRLMLDLAWQNILCWNFVEGQEMLKLVDLELQRHQQLHVSTNDKLKLKRLSGLAPAQLHYLEGKLKHREMMFAAISDDLPSAEKACEAWLAEDYPSDPAMHMMTSVQILLQSVKRDRFVLGETLALAAAMHDICIENNVMYGSVYHDSLVGSTLRMQAQYSDAEKLFINGLNDATQLHGRLSRLSATPALLLADLYYTENKVDQARSLVNEFLSNATNLGLVDQLIAGYLTTSRLHILDDNFDAAFDVLTVGFKQVAKFDFNRLEAHLIGERVRIYCLLSDTQQAAACGRQFSLMGPPANFKPDENSSTETCVLAIAWARLASVRGQSAVAIRLLKQWMQFLTERGCWEPALKVGVCLAAIAAEHSEVSIARGALRSCLVLKGADSSLRVFIDEGKQIHKLLTDLSNENDLSYRFLIDELLLIFANDPMRHYPPSVVIDFTLEGALLKDREVEILELAADDRSNAEIAIRLSLSQNTVKWYWQQIFNKLEVHRRGGAVSKAREMGLIQ